MLPITNLEASDVGVGEGRAESWHVCMRQMQHVESLQTHCPVWQGDLARQLPVVKLLPSLAPCDSGNNVTGCESTSMSNARGHGEPAGLLALLARQNPSAQALTLPAHIEDSPQQ